MDDNTRKCIITGKLNIDSLTKKKEKRIRVVAQINEVSHEREKEILDSIINGNVDEYSELAKRSVKAKLNGYKQQDIIKSLYDETLLISLHEIFIKLQQSCLLCFYCDKPVRILYRVVRDPLQWSLDRIDNSKCHSDANTVIACLGCNLKRRVTDQKKFEFTKKLIINKIK
tara:strand:+ start:4040 stop:4552 length:513 start_codon:yes stop_codon:yes gene_type:complete